MKVTVFTAKKTTGKYPASPYDDDTFEFETRNTHDLLDIFESIVSNFTLNIPLKKGTRNFRRKDNLKELFVDKVEYIMIDLDDIDKVSDRALALKWFKESGYEVVLGESRTNYRIKGVMRCDKMTPREARAVLKEIQQHVPGTMDLSAVNYASYQAPIHKHRILYQGGHKKYPVPNVTVPLPQAVTVPDAIEQLCIDAFIRQNFSFDTPTENGFRCSHPSEVKSKGGFSWDRNHPMNISHWNPDRNVSVWAEVIKLPQYKKYQKEVSKQEVKDIIPKLSSTTDRRYLDNSNKDVQNFLDNYDILKIQSPMGTAKSAVLEEVIHQSRKRGLRVLFLTNRISLADDIEKKYDGIKHYLGTELEGNNYEFGDDLVVQIDSLHKFSTKYFDICIMDEAATTMLHLLTLENHQKTITTKIFSLKKKKLVLADAFLFDDMVDVFGNNVLEITNGYRDELELDFYSQKDKFIFDLIEEAKARPITFSSGSTQILKIVKMMCEQNNLTSITISAETTKEQRKLIYKSMESCNNKWDVLMYSPSLTVGVSNENKIFTHYHLDSGLSMNVLSSIQMIKRTRKAERIRMFLGERIQYQSTDVLRIQSELTDFFAQDEDGDPTGISESGFNLSKIVRLNNTLENRHKISFLKLLKLQFKLVNINKINEKIQPFVQKLSKLVKEKEKQETLNLFEAYKTMSPEKISDIEYKMFGLTQDEQKIKMFQVMKQDETLELTEDKMNILIQSEIESPGTVEAYKMNIKDPRFIEGLTDNNFTMSQAKYNKYKKQGTDLKEYGFSKVKSRWVLQPTIIELIKI